MSSPYIAHAPSSPLSPLSSSHPLSFPRTRKMVNRPYYSCTEPKHDSTHPAWTPGGPVTVCPFSIKCEFCEWLFQSSDNLREHIELDHPGIDVLPWPPPLAQTSSPNAGERDAHEHADHGDIAALPLLNSTLVTVRKFFLFVLLLTVLRSCRYIRTKSAYLLRCKWGPGVTVTCRCPECENRWSPVS